MTTVTSALSRSGRYATYWPYRLRTYGSGRRTRVDTSEQYIKMCQKALEIQSEKCDFFEWGDYIAVGDAKYEDVGMCEAGPRSNFDRQEGETWLPRQDQLQEMVGDPIFLIIGNLDTFYTGGWRDEAWGHEDWESPQTMEQLWLMYVMYHKHGKFWNGEAWTDA
jgi:hypothetical protein